MSVDELERAKKATRILAENPMNREKWKACCAARGRVPKYELPKEAQDYIASYENDKRRDPVIASRIPDWSLFDRIYCVHYAPLTERVNPIEEELRRVGIWGCENFEMVETIRTEYEKRIDHNGLSESQVNCGLNHCEVIQRALSSGYERILILEDDVRFLKDIGLIAKVVADSPLDQDVILYDKMVNLFPSDYQDVCSKWHYEKCFCGYDVMWAASCYSLSRHGMEIIADDYANGMRVADGPLNNRTLKRVFSYVNICCQEYLEDSQFADNALDHHNFYLNQGLDYRNYNIRGSYSFALSLPTVSVVIVGRGRGRMTCEVMHRIQKYARNVKLKFIVSTDRSTPGVIQIIKDFVAHEFHDDVIFTQTNGKHYGLGAAIKNGVNEALKISDCALIVENDMLLNRDIDIGKYVRLFEESPVGIVDFKHTEKQLKLREETFCGDNYIVRIGEQSVVHSDAVRFGAFLAHRRFLDVAKFAENTRTEVAEDAFIKGYFAFSEDECIQKRILSVNDSFLRHDELNGSNCVFLHVGRNGDHSWTIPDGFDDLQCDDAGVDDTSAPINWSLYFDRILCLSFDQNDFRRNSMEVELRRIGILDSGIFEWIVARSDGNVGYYEHRCAFEKLFKQIEDKGYGRVLVFEDDILFHRDICEIKKILKHIPYAKDCIQLDKFVFEDQIDNYCRAKSGKNPHDFVDRKRSDWWTSTGCSVYSDAAVRELLKIMSENSRATMDECVHYANFSKAVAITNIAIHNLHDKSSVISRLDDPKIYLRSYTLCGTDVGSYKCDSSGRHEQRFSGDDINGICEYFNENRVLFATNGDYSDGCIWNRCLHSYSHLTGGGIYFVGKEKYGKDAFIEIFKYAIEHEYRFVIYVDCDCFIVNDANLANAFYEFTHEDAAFMGVSEGGIVCHRSCNPMAINPFLMFANIGKVKRYWGGRQFSFDDPVKFHGWNDAGASMNSWLRSYISYRDFRTSHKEYVVPYASSGDYWRHGWKGSWDFDFGFKQWEPYYDIFLGMQDADCGCRYFIGRDYPCEKDPDGMTTALYHFGKDENVDLQDDSRIICLHTWLSRCVMWGQKDRVKRIEDVISFAERMKGGAIEYSGALSIGELHVSI